MRQFRTKHKHLHASMWQTANRQIECKNQTSFSFQTYVSVWTGFYATCCTYLEVCDDTHAERAPAAQNEPRQIEAGKPSVVQAHEGMKLLIAHVHSSDTCRRHATLHHWNRVKDHTLPRHNIVSWCNTPPSCTVSISIQSNQKLFRHQISFLIFFSAVKRLIASKMKVFVYIIYMCVLCIFMYIYI